MKWCEARLFDRPTPVEGEDGMENWLQMFCGRYFEGLTGERTKEKIREIVAILRPERYREGVWTVDYRRLRVAAVEVQLAKGFALDIPSGYSCEETGAQSQNTRGVGAKHPDDVV